MSVPAGLGAPGRRLYQAVHERWELRPDEEIVLVEAARTLSELRRLELKLRKVEAVVPGSKGQERAHPLFGEVRSHRLALRQLLASIGLEEDVSAGAARSAAGRALARKRWSGQVRAVG